MPGTDQHDRAGQCNRQTPTTNAFIVLSTRDPASTAYSYRFVEGSEKGSGMAVWTSREVVSRGDPKSTLFTTRVRFTALRSVIVDGYTVVTKVLHCNEFRYTCRVSNRLQLWEVSGKFHNTRQTKKPNRAENIFSK